MCKYLLYHTKHQRFFYMKLIFSSNYGEVKVLCQISILKSTALYTSMQPVTMVNNYFTAKGIALMVL